MLYSKKVRFNKNITFRKEELIGFTSPRDDALVVIGDIVNFDVKRMLVDGGSATNVHTRRPFWVENLFKKIKSRNHPFSRV